jgi:hypothetical protein
VRTLPELGRPREALILFAPSQETLRRKPRRTGLIKSPFPSGEFFRREEIARASFVVGDRSGADGFDDRGLPPGSPGHRARRRYLGLCSVFHHSAANIPACSTVPVEHPSDGAAKFCRKSEVVGRSIGGRPPACGHVICGDDGGRRRWSRYDAARYHAAGARPSAYSAAGNAAGAAV